MNNLYISLSKKEFLGLIKPNSNIFRCTYYNSGNGSIGHLLLLAQVAFFYAWSQNMSDIIRKRFKRMMNNIVYKIITFLLICFIIVISLFIMYMLQNIKVIKDEIARFDERLNSIINEFIRYRAELDIIEEMMMERNK